MSGQGGWQWRVAGVYELGVIQLPLTMSSQPITPPLTLFTTPLRKAAR